MGLQINPKHKQVVALSLSGNKPAVIAEKLNMSRNSVIGIINRVRKKGGLPSLPLGGKKCMK